MENTEEEEAEEEGGWITTFADLMSLLLTFFILLLSFAQMDIVKFRDAMGSMKDAFGYAGGEEGPFSKSSSELIRHEHAKLDTNVKVTPLEMRLRKMGREQSVIKVVEKKNEEILKKLNESIASNNLMDMVSAEATGQGVVVRVNGEMFFASGSAELKESAFPLLDDIINIIEDSDFMVNIEGHTDNTPIETEKFPSNWELSSARAISALKYIINSGRVETGRLGAVGYADTRPIASNDDEEGRAINRRIEFIFYAKELMSNG